MSFKLEEICEEFSQIQIPRSPEELEAIGVSVVEEVSADEAESFRDGYVRDIRSCLAARRRNDCRGRLVRPAVTEAIFSGDPVEAYLAWQLTDSWQPYDEGLYPDRDEGDVSPLMPPEGLPEGLVGPGNALDYLSIDPEAIESWKAEKALERKVEREKYHDDLKESALVLGRYLAPEATAFIKQNKDVLLDLLWETDDHRRRVTKRPDLPAVTINEAREDIERYLDSLVVVPAVRASHGDPTEARRRVREALRLFCNGGEAPPKGKSETGKRVKGFGLDPQVVIKASQLESRFQKALTEYNLRQEIWQEALKLLSPKSPPLIRANPDPSFAEKVIAGVIHSFPRTWKEERVAGQGRKTEVVFHPASWDESNAQGQVTIRTKPLIAWLYLAGGFDTTAAAVRFLADPETRERLGLLGPNWIEEAKRIVFGAYKRSRQG